MAVTLVNGIEGWASCRGSGGTKFGSVQASPRPRFAGGPGA